MLSNCLLAGELALDGDSEELILIRLCWKTWHNLLTEVGATCPWTFTVLMQNSRILTFY